jgi:predicted O-methyltransferase YrrM
MSPAEIPGQLNPEERRLITSAIVDAPKKPRVVLEVGTWLGGGSTLSILRALENNGQGHLWGIEADRSIYDQMLENIRLAAPAAAPRFTPLFGLSQRVIPKWIAEQGPQFEIDVAFLDGGNNPMEQVTEFELIDPRIPVGGILMAHDAKLRKGKWLVPYVVQLDNWKSKLYDVSAEGLFFANKTAARPSPNSLRSAHARLLRMRLEPAELAAALLPASICGAILKILPAKISLKLAQGRTGSGGSGTGGG